MAAIPSLGEVRSTVERMTGGRVTDIERQPRWRPTWFVTLKPGGSYERLVVRGDRFDANALPLAHEYTFHKILEEAGIKVPKLYGYVTIGELEAILMEFVPGKANFADPVGEDRDTVVDEYLQQLAAIHSLDPAPFIAAGIKQPPVGVDPAFARHLQRVEHFRKTTVGPEPFVEFCLGWLKRHEPTSARPLTPCLVDTGQFHHQDGHLTAVIDLEFGQLGDPLQDLAVWRMRDTLIPFGDMNRLYARYEELTGRPVDMEAIRWHHMAGAIGNAIMFAPAVARPEPETDVMTYMQWDSETNLMASDFLCEFYEIDQPELDIPEVEPNRDHVIFNHLVGHLRSIVSDDREAQHKLRLSFRMARHLLRRSEVGDELDRQDIADVEALLGGQFDCWEAATAALEGFVLADAETGEHDVALTRLFHKRNLRSHMQMGPKGSSMNRHYECQRFDGKPTRIVQL